MKVYEELGEIVMKVYGRIYDSHEELGEIVERWREEHDASQQETVPLQPVIQAVELIAEAAEAVDPPVFSWDERMFIERFFPRLIPLHRGYAEDGTGWYSWSSPDGDFTAVNCVTGMFLMIGRRHELTRLDSVLKPIGSPVVWGEGVVQGYVCGGKKIDLIVYKSKRPDTLPTDR